MHGAHRLVANIFVAADTHVMCLCVEFVVLFFFSTLAVFSMFDVAFYFYLQFNFTIYTFGAHFSLPHYAVRHTCGEEAAHFTRNILDRMSFSLRRVSERIYTFLPLSPCTFTLFIAISFAHMLTVQFLMRL